MIESALIVTVLLVVTVGAIYRRWLEHERARYDEIGRRERLRILLRHKDPRK